MKLKFDYDRFKARFQEVLSGNVFRRGWFRRQYKLAGLIIVLFGLYIDNGYRAQRQQVRLIELDKQIEDAHHEYLSLSAMFVDQTRQSVIAERLQEQGSNIRISRTPAIRIE